MLPNELQADQFSAYPAQAKRLAIAHLDTFQKLPLSFLPGLLRQLIEYDYKFPVEQAAMDRELISLSSLSPTDLQEWFRGFFRITLSAKLERLDWVNQPVLFVEQESAHLWSTHQMDAFSAAATSYGDRLQAVAGVESLPVRRLGIAIIGQGVPSFDSPLFRNLRAHGTCFTQVKPEDGVESLLAAVEDRAKVHPLPYRHWYIEGGQPARATASLTTVSYAALAPVRESLLKFMQSEIARPGMGPEELRTKLARLLPADLGLNADGDAVLDRFRVKLFTEGSGTQIFSTTFAQWTTREALRRAQPLTLLVRFAPRQRQKPMNELLSDSIATPELDPLGSLVDADMGSYYHWINQQRLAGAEHSSFLVWFEGHREALVISPSLPRGVLSDSPMDLKGLLSLATS
jgi:hypothetical protein